MRAFFKILLVLMVINEPYSVYLLFTLLMRHRDLFKHMVYINLLDPLINVIEMYKIQSNIVKYY